MSKNILDAVMNIVKSNTYNLQIAQIRSNRANSMSDALEKYVIDSFADSINENDENIRNIKVSKAFSYLGNDSNPPDAMLHGGAAIETKKIQSRLSQLQLNSSYPKSKLYKDDSRITSKAIAAEEWIEKDFIYAIGFVKEKQLKELALIDASVYCADTETYTGVFEAVKDGIDSITNVDFSPTKELGRVNRIDPLGITNLRIRGMWLLENPFKVFDHIYSPNEKSVFNLFALISDEHFDDFKNSKELLSLVELNNSLKIKDEKVKNPNNPAQLINCKKITFYV
ncbi:hypothetical protein RyT2_23550 [Pseudolactococcus yaeyamensis]